jgi:hypothetical protein
VQRHGAWRGLLFFFERPWSERLLEGPVPASVLACGKKRGKMLLLVIRTGEGSRGCLAVVGGAKLGVK